MRASGSRTSGRARGLRGIPMEILTLESSSKGRRMAKEFTLGSMGRFMMVSGISD